MLRIGLKDIPLNNFALDILKETEWFVKDKNYTSVILGSENLFNAPKREFFTSDGYLKKIMDMGTNHNGFPEVLCGYSFGMGNLRFVNQESIEEKAEIVSENLQNSIRLLSTNFCLKRNALFCVYPPGGYISWHNNANASAYNFIFTWSETGDGCFEYWNPDSKEIITIPDVKGWQCKAGYFGNYEQDKRTWCYHSANTDCLRMTVAFTLSRDEMALGMQDMIIEDICA